MSRVDFRELQLDSTVWPPTLASVVDQVRAALPAGVIILRWAVTAAERPRLRVEVIFYEAGG